MGFNCASNEGDRVADDFKVSGVANWHLEAIDFYLYQANMRSTSPLTAINYRIWDGPPNDDGSSVIYGDTTTNRLESTFWSDVFRAHFSDAGTTARYPVMVVRASADVELAPGTYWLDWQGTGTTAESGPYAVPITDGECITGNGLRYRDDFDLWLHPLDEFCSGRQGFPFTLYGSSAGAVDLVSLSASRFLGGVLVEWETASELGSVGFHVWRSDRGDGGEYRRLTENMIAAMGGVSQGSSYRFEDREASPGLPCSYKIEDIATDGSSNVPWSCVGGPDRSKVGSRSSRECHHLGGYGTDFSIMEYAFFRCRDTYHDYVAASSKTPAVTERSVTGTAKFPSCIGAARNRCKTGYVSPAVSVRVLVFRTL